MVSVPTEEITGWLTPQKAAAHIGALEGTLRKALAQGRVVGVKQEGRWLVPLQEAERWRVYFSTINREFEWLQCSVGQRPQAVYLMTPPRVARALGTSQAILGWPRANLLPFFFNEFNASGKTQPARLFVRPYIEGLARFSGRKRVPIRDARWYAELCTSKGKIM